MLLANELMLCGSTTLRIQYFIKIEPFGVEFAEYFQKCNHIAPTNAATRWNNHRISLTIDLSRIAASHISAIDFKSNPNAKEMNL